MKEKKDETIREIHDQGVKAVFEDLILCADFLRDYVNLDILKDITPKQITNISERFVTLWDEERSSDTVNRIELSDGSMMYFIALIEHQSAVSFEMCMKIVAAFLHRLNVPRDEVAEFTDMIKERRISMLFDSFEAYDVQETRRVSREEGRIEGVKSCVIDFLQELGEIPEELTSRINSETDVNVLKQWLKLAAKTQTIDEFKSRVTGNN